MITTATDPDTTIGTSDVCATLVDLLSSKPEIAPGDSIDQVGTFDDFDTFIYGADFVIDRGADTRRRRWLPWRVTRVRDTDASRSTQDPYEGVLIRTSEGREFLVIVQPA